MNKKLWKAYLCISEKVESDGKGTDHSPIEGFKQVVDEFTELFPPNKYKKVLNIGAGGGAETRLLVDAGYEVVGTTLGKDNVSYAKSEYDIDLLEFDMHYLNFKPGEFDAIFMIQTQEHALSSWIFALEMYFVLRDGGAIYTDLPSPEGGAQLSTIWHTSVLYPDQWRALMWKAGFIERSNANKKDRYRFMFEKAPQGKFKMWGYVQHIYKRRLAIFKQDGSRELVWNKQSDDNMSDKEPITFCQMTNNYEGTKTCIEQVLPYVDRVIIVSGEITEEERELLMDLDREKVFVYYFPWEDNFSGMRNNYINKLIEFGTPYGWALVSDHDEVLSDNACKLLRQYVDDSNGGIDYSVVKINSHDVTYNLKGEKVQDNQSDWFKDLLFKVWGPNTYYVGNPHEGLRSIITGAVKMPKSAVYYHIKTFTHIIRRGCENFYVGGGGDNMRETNPTWVELMKLSHDIGIHAWNDFEEYMKSGDIDQRIKDWMIRYRNTNERPWADSELRGFFIYYFHYLNPEERPEGIDTSYTHYVPMEKDTGIVSRIEPEGDVSILE